MVLSKPANTLAGGWWIVHTTATFCVAATVCKKLIMRTALAESTPEVGSSRNKMFGLFDERERHGQTALVAAGQTSGDLVARARVHEVLQPDRARHVVHGGALSALVQLGAEQGGGVREVLSDGERRPQRVGLLDVRARAVVQRGRQRLAVDVDEAGGRAAALLQRQHVQQSGLAGAGGAEDGQHVPGRHLTLDVLQKRLGGRALHRDGVVQALEGEAHLLALHGCHGSERPGGDARAKKQTRARRVRARGCVDRVDAAEKKRRNVALVALCA
jgi:hypothetical protein